MKKRGTKCDCRRNERHSGARRIYGGNICQTLFFRLFMLYSSLPVARPICFDNIKRIIPGGVFDFLKICHRRCPTA